MSFFHNFQDRVGHRGLMLTVCVPLWCSCLMWIMGSRQQTLANVPDLPGLAFHQYMVDLQEVAPTEEVFAAFDFRNTSNHPITITKLEPSCGCLQPQMRKTVYQPGEAGNFILRVKTAFQKPGFKEFTVAVHYTDSKPRTRDVFLRVVFPEKQLFVTPRSLTFSQSGSKSFDSELIMTDLRTKPARIIGVASSTDLLQLKVQDPVKTKQGAQQQLVRVTLPNAVPAGRHLATVTIYTDDEEFHELKVPVQIFGPNKHTVADRVYGPQTGKPTRR